MADLPPGEEVNLIILLILLNYFIDLNVLSLKNSSRNQKIQLARFYKNWFINTSLYLSLKFKLLTAISPHNEVNSLR